MQPAGKIVTQFQRDVLRYYKRSRRDFQWRTPTIKLRADGTARDPYRVLVSEIMLQQTQTTRVCGKFPAFISQFPNFAAVARAPLRKVLRAWQGLGYNKRALYLKQLSQIVVQKYKGILPDDECALAGLPGIGTATAGAIIAFAFNKPTIFTETNIRRAFIHTFFKNRGKVSDKEILSLLERCNRFATKRLSPREWYYALMDYGAMLGEIERQNPNRKSAHYTKQSRFENSDRQVRGKIVAVLLAGPKTAKQLAGKIQCSGERLTIILRKMRRDGLVQKRNNRYAIR